MMHETTIASRNLNAVCRRCAQTFKRGEKVFVAGREGRRKYYCIECADVIVIEVE